MSKKNLLIFLFFVLYLFSLAGSLNKLEICAAEPKRAIVSMEMVLNGQYTVPTINGESYYNKPPLFNWVQTFFFHLFNSFDEWVCRIPGVLSLLLTAILLFFLGRNLFNRKTGLFASVFFLTSSDIFLYGSVRAGSVDLFLSLLIFIQIASLLYFTKRKQYLVAFISSWGFASLGFLTKGLPSILAQFLSLGIIFLYNKEFKRLFSLKHIAGFLAFLIPTGLYLYAFSKEDDLISLLINLVSESSTRYETHYGLTDLLKQLIYMPQRLFINLLLPWSVILLLLIKKKVRNSLRNDREFHLLLLVVLTNMFIYFIAPDYHNRYLYPFIAFMCLLLARIFTASGKITENAGLRNGLSILYMIMGLALISLFFLPDFKEVSFLKLKVILLCSGFFIHAYISRRNSWNPAISLAIAITGLHVVMNMIYLPSVQGKGLLTFRARSQEILELTSHQQVILTGGMDIFHVSLAPGGKKIPNTERIIKVPPMLPYQLPYYLTRETGKIMEYREIPDTRGYYISRIEDLPEVPVEELLRFDDNFLGYRLVLFYVSAPSSLVK